MVLQLVACLEKNQSSTEKKKSQGMTMNDTSFVVTCHSFMPKAPNVSTPGRGWVRDRDKSHMGK